MKDWLIDLWISIKDFFGGILVLLLLAIPFLLELLDAFHTPRTNIFLYIGIIEIVIALVIGMRGLWKRRKSARKEPPNMKKLIPLKKQSKFAQKEHAARQRGSWEGVKPVTRVVESKKHYSRKRLEKPSAEE